MTTPDTARARIQADEAVTRILADLPPEVRAAAIDLLVGVSVSCGLGPITLEEAARIVASDGLRRFLCTERRCRHGGGHPAARPRCQVPAPRRVRRVPALHVLPGGARTSGRALCVRPFFPTDTQMPLPIGRVRDCGHGPK